MFDIEEFMNEARYDETTVIRRGTTEFRIRRLNGAERLKFNDLSTRFERVRFALGRALLSGVDGRPIGEENAVRLLERSGALAEALFADIFEFTALSTAKEAEIWSKTLKNSTAAQETSTERSCADSADDTRSNRP